MANLLDYLDWRGGLSFSAAGLCEADNLIFSMLSYLDFAGLVPEEDPAGLPLRDIVPRYFELHPPKKGALGLLLSDEILDLLDELRSALPMEVKKAQELLAAREKYVEDAKREVDRMRRQA